MKRHVRIHARTHALTHAGKREGRLERGKGTNAAASDTEKELPPEKRRSGVKWGGETTSEADSRAGTPPSPPGHPSVTREGRGATGKDPRGPPPRRRAIRAVPSMGGGGGRESSSLLLFSWAVARPRSNPFCAAAEGQVRGVAVGGGLGGWGGLGQGGRGRHLGHVADGPGVLVRPDLSKHCSKR